METLWFCLIAVMIAVYVVLDGFDLGAGVIHLFVAKTNEERKAVLESIGPFFDGNEVWLLAAAGTIFFAFPALYASSFQGFYLPLMVVLWLFMARGLSLELRNHLDTPVWRPLWDAGFSASSGLLAIVFGAALGNIVRGVPLDDGHEFFLPFWTNWTPGTSPGILDWFTVTTGVTALAALTLHGSLWVSYKTTGAVAERSSKLVMRLFIPVGILTVVLSLMTFAVQPHVLSSFRQDLWGVVFPLLAIAGLVYAFIMNRARKELNAFLGSCAYLTGMLTSAAFGLFPYVLPSCLDAGASLTISNAAPAAYGLRIALFWWLPGMALAIGYSAFVHRRFAGKVRVDATNSAEAPLSE